MWQQLSQTINVATTPILGGDFLDEATEQAVSVLAQRGARDYECQVVPDFWTGG